MGRTICFFVSSIGKIDLVELIWTSLRCRGHLSGRLAFLRVLRRGSCRWIILFGTIGLGYTIVGSRPREARKPRRLAGTLLYMIAVLENEKSFSPSPPHLLQLQVLQMALSSNVIIHGGTFNSAQGDLHINNRNSESGMHDFRSVQKRILIDDPMKDFIS